MGSLKWIGGLLGWVSGGPIGALLGVLLGSLAESGVDAVKQLTGTGTGQGSWQQRSGQNSTQGSWQQRTGQTGSRQSASGQGSSTQQQRNSFMVSLLVLSSAVIRADGKTQQSELDYVKAFIRQNFGEAAVQDASSLLQQLENQNIDIYSVGTQIATYMNYSQRLQLFHYLCGIANADGDFCKQEKSVLEAIGSAIRLNSADISSVIAMFYKDSTSAYAVLEISPNATDEEVKTAYRRMAMKNHPDKVASLGEDVQKAAEEKFRKIQEAYETIKKERGMN